MRAGIDWRRAIRYSIRDYFAPLTGAYEGIRDEKHRVDREERLGREPGLQGAKAKPAQPARHG